MHANHLKTPKLGEENIKHPENYTHCREREEGLDWQPHEQGGDGRQHSEG